MPVGSQTEFLGKQLKTERGQVVCECKLILIALFLLYKHF